MWSLALVLAVGAAQPAEPVTLSRRLACSAAAVRSPQLSDRSSRRFSATRILDLEFDVAPPTGHARARPLTLRVLTPNGHLYETLAPEAVTLPPSRGPERTGLRARLPVAGTPIVTSSLYGRWSVVPYLEGDSEACGRPTAFWVDP